jgi:hypothetical protein
MRSLIRELPYERPLVAGLYRYQRGDTPTGVVEQWRLSAAQDGYHFLRVDLNAEASTEGHSTLYHLVLNALGDPERLSFRDFRRGRELRGTVLFEGPYVTLTRQLDGERREVTLEQPAETRFWFPASAALGLVCEPGTGPGLTLNRADDFNLWPTHLEVSAGAPATLTIMGRPVATQRLDLAWAGERRVVWSDAEPWPLQVDRGEVVAVETRRLHYRRSPGQRIVSDIGDDHGI